MPTATSLSAKSLEQLLAQAGGSFGGKTPEIAGPAPALYGVYGSAQAGAQQALTADPYFGAMHLANLGNQADKEQQDYEDQLLRQQAATLQAQETAGYYGVLEKGMDKTRGDAPIGTYGTPTLQANGHYGITIDPVLAAADNAVEFDGKTAENFGKRATGVGTLATAGFAPTPTDLSAFLRNPLENVDDAVKYGVYKTPTAIAELIRADKAESQADRVEIETLRGKFSVDAAQARELLSQGKAKIQYNPITGEPTITMTGDPAELIKQAPGITNDIRTQNGLPPNPDAGVSGAGTSATQGTAGFFSPSRINSKKGVRNDPFTGKPREHKGNDYKGKAGEIFPAEHDGEVIAVGPKQGFGDNVVTVRYDNGETAFYGHGRRALVQTGQRVKAGQGLGEVGSEGRSTGPHVHKQILTAAHHNVEGVTPAPAGVKLPTGVKASPIDVILVKAQQHGAQVKEEGVNIRVTLPDGRTRLYDVNGKVVG